MDLNPQKLVKGFYHHAFGKYQEVTSFIVLVFFLTTFVLARLHQYLADANWIPDIYLFLGQTHVHHLNYGIFLLSIVGYLALIYHDEKVNEILAIFFGIGLGLTFDEFALWLFLENDYYARASYEAIIIITALLINIIYLGNVWKRIFKFVFRR